MKIKLKRIEEENDENEEEKEEETFHEQSSSFIFSTFSPFVKVVTSLP